MTKWVYNGICINVLPEPSQQFGNRYSVDLDTYPYIHSFFALNCKRTYTSIVYRESTWILFDGKKILTRFSQMDYIKFAYVHRLSFDYTDYTLHTIKCILLCHYVRHSLPFPTATRILPYIFFMFCCCCCCSLLRLHFVGALLYTLRNTSIFICCTLYGVCVFVCAVPVILLHLFSDSIYTFFFVVVPFRWKSIHKHRRKQKKEYSICCFAQGITQLTTCVWEKYSFKIIRIIWKAAKTRREEILSFSYTCIYPFFFFFLSIDDAFSVNWCIAHCFSYENLRFLLLLFCSLSV